MRKDAIVEKIHPYREARAKKFNYDALAMTADMKAKQKQYELQGWKIVSFCASDSHREVEVGVGKLQMLNHIERLLTFSLTYNTGH